MVDGPGEGLTGGTDVGRVLGAGVFGAGVVAVDGAGITVLVLGGGDAGCAPGAGVLPHAVRPAIAAPATASSAISVVLMPSACAAGRGPVMIRKSLSGRQRSRVPGLRGPEGPALQTARWHRQQPRPPDGHRGHGCAAQARHHVAWRAFPCLIYKWEGTGWMRGPCPATATVRFYEARRAAASRDRCDTRCRPGAPRRALSRYRGQHP